MLISLLLSAFLWALHVLSLDYSAFLQYRVRVTTEMVGYSTSAVAEEVLMVRGKAAGYYILKARGFGDDPMDLEITVDKSLLAHEEGTVFTLPVQSIREKIMEALDEHIVIDFFDTEVLTLRYERQSYRHVPVTVVANLDFRPQYMQVGEIQTNPDSVYVYGAEENLLQITEIKTEPVSLDGLDATANGFVTLEVPRGVKLNKEQAGYSIKVDRYVEVFGIQKVMTTNVPSGKSLVTLPSEVQVRCRIPFGAKQNAFLNSLSVSVDYRDVVKSRSANMIPELVNGSKVPVYAFEITPTVVECIIVDD